MKLLNPSRTRPVILVALPNVDLYKEVFNLGIKPACKEIIAISELAVDGTMNNRLYRKKNIQIENSDIIISDMTEVNKNVYGIAGYARGLGKKIIYLHRYKKELIFSIESISLSINLPCVVYGEDYDSLKNRLVKMLKELLNIPV